MTRQLPKPTMHRRTVKMADFPALTLKECADRIISTEKPLVLMHIRPDGDTVGSCAALCEIFKELGREVKYACDDAIPDRLAFLLSDFEPAEELDGYDPVSIDVASPSQLGGLADKINVCFMIDHHEISTPFAPHYTVRGASSAGEVLYSIARELEARGLIKISQRMAYLLYAAISSDTGGFIFSNAKESTYLAAAHLVSLGIDHADANHRLFMSKSKDQILAEGFTASKLKTHADGRISYATISRADAESLGIGIEHFETAIDIVRSVLGSQIAFVIKETDRGLKASMRSVGANVAEVAARHGGGGHIRAAGCNIVADSAEDAARILLSELEEIL